ncbi:MAG: FAD-dependent monooxygenase [Parachlamydiales bacterium]|nr:FAD-dependent monooxygenase [Parachlamydiales bacterium]
MSTISSYSQKVVIAGAGPVGLALACTLKSQNKYSDITVYDKRPDPYLEFDANKHRTHGLRISRDAISFFNKILKKEIKHNPNINVSGAKDLQKQFSGWKGRFVRTHQIQSALSEKAKKLGVKVLYNCGISAQDLESLKNHDLESLNQVQKDLKEAQVIIGCDGSHSPVRDTLLKEKLSDVKMMQHLLELKFNTHVNVRQRSSKTASIHNAECEEVDFESIGQAGEDGLKPGTLHLVIDEATFNALRPKKTSIKTGDSETESIKKGDSAHPWNLAELKLAAQTDRRIEKVYKTLMHYVASLHKRRGDCINERISTLPLEIYRAENVCNVVNGKVVAICGDASSGLIYERGFNKGIKEAGLCALAVSDFFKSQADLTQKLSTLPQSFKRYNQQSKDLFVSERRWITFKITLIKIYKTFLYYIGTPYAMFRRNILNKLRTKLFKILPPAC